MSLRGLIWDVDGTLAETERDGHRLAFNLALAEHGATWQWDVATYGRLLRVAGGYERLLFDLEQRDDAPATAGERVHFAKAVHARKNVLYAELVEQGRIHLRPGVERLMAECEREGIALAIATTTSRANVDALLKRTLGPTATDRFAAIICAEEAPRKKPDPAAYRLALDGLSMAAKDAMAVEDSPNGLEAACAVGIATLITRSTYFVGDDFAGCAGICDDLDSRVTWETGEAPRVDVEALRSLHAASIAQHSPSRST
jgi:HAD superfamily hydrolase (TIGR01509 family)